MIEGRKTNFHRHSAKFINNIQKTESNTFHTINSQIFNHEDVQKKAQQQLLDLEYQINSQTKNPQANFMALIKNVRFNTFKKQKSKSINQHEQDFISKDKFRRTKSNIKSHKKTLQKVVSYAYISGKKTQIPSILQQQNDKRLSLNQKIQNYFIRTKSNLLTPRQSLPTIYSSQNNFSVLARKTKSSLKPYSSGKSINSNVKLLSIIKLRQQLSILPAIDKELKRRRILGYD